jgi:hypothetical protein
MSCIERRFSFSSWYPTTMMVMLLTTTPKVPTVCNCIGVPCMLLCHTVTVAI